MLKPGTHEFDPAFNEYWNKQAKEPLGISTSGIFEYTARLAYLAGVAHGLRRGTKAPEALKPKRKRTSPSVGAS